VGAGVGWGGAPCGQYRQIRERWIDDGPGRATTRVHPTASSPPSPLLYSDLCCSVFRRGGSPSVLIGTVLSVRASGEWREGVGTRVTCPPDRVYLPSRQGSIKAHPSAAHRPRPYGQY